MLGEQVRVQVVEGQPGDVAQEGGDVGVGAVEALGDDVDLGAPARGQHRRLADVVARDRPTTALPRSSGAIASRSSTASGAVRWFTPMTTIDMCLPAYALRAPPRAGLLDGFLAAGGTIVPGTGVHEAVRCADVVGRPRSGAARRCS